MAVSCGIPRAAAQTMRKPDGDAGATTRRKPSKSAGFAASRRIRAQPLRTRPNHGEILAHVRCACGMT
jgi:hypothetical protein